MRKLALVAACLLLGLVAGLLLRPDDGTPVSISPTEGGAAVSGANHGKPLPRVPTASVDLKQPKRFLYLVTKAHWSSSGPPATEATSQAAAVTASAVSSISAHRCLIAWKAPIFWPNCSRTLA